ncbi:MAG: TetR/AcrR family transcriptional regulator [Brevundimonas sp.]|nr:MAG: TetR/AcrR family transcriptional regulator [Brevundimonas sp.]
MDQALDRRTQRTRKAISDAFVGLLFSRRYSAIRTADVIEAAGVGRSTFYEHFRNKDDVLVAVIEPLFTPLADAAAGRGQLGSVLFMLDHVWEQRANARLLFEPPLGAKLQRKLAAMIEARLTDAEGGAPPALVAMGAAAGALAMLRMWLAGEVPCSSGTLARRLISA